MAAISQKIHDKDDPNNETDTIYQKPVVRNGTLSCPPFIGSSVSKNEFWSKHGENMSYNQLQKFWCELSVEARKKLLRIDKQALFEHVRKNMYCSKCNGLLLEDFLQLVMWGKSLNQSAAGRDFIARTTIIQNDGNDVPSPSVCPWGGLTSAGDVTLTLLDCYLNSQSLKGLQSVFDSAYARERERKLLYPDACGGGGRGWIRQGMAGCGRGHGTRDTCALHTARLSVETLVDFWSALGEETQQSLLRMKEDDFIERLMFRFESKRFCKDCRKNVIREFKELKELKRIRKEPRCNRWFCVADTAFQYEVSYDTVQADWHQMFEDEFVAYHHFEWAIGTGEGKSDILEFENVGLSDKVQVSGLDLSDLDACYITLRAWKTDGRCNELCVKAHAMEGQRCVHCRLVVGDEFVTITKGGSIRRFFKHAEEAEEEEDDDSLDNDANEFDGQCSHPQKHAKTPELAREFLLDAATVIFKEQVEKAFREGTARQNAHSIFVCLALSLLEERMHVACKEIITLEKQMKLLEEEEKEKHEEEERKERRKTKEREKKLRKKERLRVKENEDKKCAEPNVDPVTPIVSKEEETPCVDESGNVGRGVHSLSENAEASPASPLTPNVQENQILTDHIYSNVENHFEGALTGEFCNSRDRIASFSYDHFKYSGRKLKFRDDSKQDWNLKCSTGRRDAVLSENGVVIDEYETWNHDNAVKSMRSIHGFNKQLRTNAAKSYGRNGCPKFSEKLQGANNGTVQRSNFLARSCNRHKEYKSRPESHAMGAFREAKHVNKLECESDTSMTYYHDMFTQGDCTCEITRRPPNLRKVWEPLHSQKKYYKSHWHSDIALKSTRKVEASESDQHPESSGDTCPDVAINISVETSKEDNNARAVDRSTSGKCRDGATGSNAMAKSQKYQNETVVKSVELSSATRSPDWALDLSLSSFSNSGKSSSCLSEGDSNSSSSVPKNTESASTSDSEEYEDNSEETESSNCHGCTMTECQRVVDLNTSGQDLKNQGPTSGRTISLGSLHVEPAPSSGAGRSDSTRASQPQIAISQMHNPLSIRYPLFPAPTAGYYLHSSASLPANPTHGLMSFPHPDQYLFANTFGHDLNGASQFIQYPDMQHLASPFSLNPAHVPVFPAQTNGFRTKEPAKPANLVGRKEAQQIIPNVASTEQQPVKTTTAVDAGQNGKTGKMAKGNNDFSLFHFGGPIAFSKEFKADPVSPKEKTIWDSSLNISASGPGGDNRPCNKKDTVEQYNLFAANNGIQFSFF